MTLADWIALLHISTGLQFTKIGTYAIRELTARRASIAAVDAIVIAKEHDLPSWLWPAYAELVRRQAPLDDQEAERLGARTTAQVGRAREMLRTEEYALYQQRRHGRRYAPPERPDEQLVARAVNEVFNLMPTPHDDRNPPGSGGATAPIPSRYNQRGGGRTPARNSSSRTQNPCPNGGESSTRGGATPGRPAGVGGRARMWAYNSANF